MKFVLTITLAVMAVVPTTATAEDNLALRAATSIGRFIANQGNAALVQIREELKNDLLKQLKPYRPEREDVAPNPPSRSPQPQS